MINKPPLFTGFNIRIPIIIPIKGRGFINRGSGLALAQGAAHKVGELSGLSEVHALQAETLNPEQKFPKTKNPKPEIPKPKIPKPKHSKPKIPKP